MIAEEALMVLDPPMEFDRSTFALLSRALDRAIDGLSAEIAQDNPASLLKQILETRIASQIVLVRLWAHADRACHSQHRRDHTRSNDAGAEQRGIRSARGGKWHASSVMNLLARAQNFASFESHSAQRVID